MKRNLFSVSFLTASIIGISSVCAFAQQPTAENPCPELKPEQIKQLTPENKKKYDEELKKCKEDFANYSTKKAKVETANKVIPQMLKEGNEAFNLASTARSSKNYEQAIGSYSTAVEKYQAGYDVDTEYWESAPLFLILKGDALRGRGVAKHTIAIQAKDNAGKEAAKKDLSDSVDSLTKAIDFYNKTTPPTEAANAKKFQETKTAAYAARVESFRILLQLDASRAEEGAKVFQEYIAMETDPAKKQKAQENLANALFASGNLDAAVAEYQKILAGQPNNPDALYYMGTALIASGEDAKVKEGVKHLESLIKSAPSGYDQAKIADAKGLIDVSTQKEPAKPTSTKRKN